MVQKRKNLIMQASLEKLNSSWSDVVFQIEPKSSTVLSFLVLIEGPAVVFAYDSSFSVRGFAIGVTELLGI